MAKPWRRLVPTALLFTILCGCSGAPASGSSVAPQTRGIMRALTPTLLELELEQPKAPAPAKLKYWQFATNGLPKPGQLLVKAGQETIAVKRVGFKQRVSYAPLKKWDLRVTGWLYLELSRALNEGEMVVVQPSGGAEWPVEFRGSREKEQLSPLLHVNQTGYDLNGPKVAYLGGYLGTLGELDFSSQPQLLNFEARDAATGQKMFVGVFSRRPDVGFPDNDYQQVYQADFSGLKTAGTYKLHVNGLGITPAFWIGDSVSGVYARTYALGLYHQRCGAANALPFTRFTHGPCHTNRAEVPTMNARYEAANESLRKETANAKENVRHKARPLSSVTASLYPFQNKGPVDVTGGHHDAGDYSKYIINSAGLIHHLVFAADCFPGAVKLDNLGLPESGDGKSDLLQEAKIEADFLRKMQDADGGFYFLVYPREREYEDNVLPDAGDSQIVFPKTTAATAAAVAALAQCSSSPEFSKQFPLETSLYRESALKGWRFLTNAIAKHGQDGAYQKITHYGDEFMHDDELAWAACEVYLATGDSEAGRRLKQWLRPSSPEMRKWGWLRMFDAYGCAIRSYGFAEASGRAKTVRVDEQLLGDCQDEVAFAGQDQLRRCRESAYGVSFPEETKRARSAGWFFAADPAFELATACQLDYPKENDPRPAMLDAIYSNLNFEAGANPINVSYLTGIGWKRQFEIVHQYSQNDRRRLPLSGIPLGCIQGGITWVHVYQSEPMLLSFPSDAANAEAYPFYDRWSDAFNLSQEFVVLHLGRGLGVSSWLMARTPAANQAWNSEEGTLVRNGQGHWQLAATKLYLKAAQVLLETSGDFKLGSVTNTTPGKDWVEAEALLPDGRRVFAVTNLTSRATR